MVLDIVVILVLLISAFIAFLRGFIREVLTIFGIVGGVVASYIGGPLLIPVIRGWLGVTEMTEGEEPQKLFDLVPYSMVADVLAYGAILVVFVIILSIISHFISEFAKTIGLGALDRTLGVVFGLARGILLLGLLYLPVFYLMDEDQKVTNFGKESRTRIHLEAVSGWIASYIPSETAEKIKQGAEKIEDTNIARQKLQSMDLLKDSNNTGKKSNADPKENNNQENGKDPQGYTEEFRKNMDHLFEENSDNKTKNNE